MNKKDTIIHRVVKVLFTLLVLMGATQYFFNHDMVVGMFESLLFPTYLIYPMGVAKYLGVIVIWAKVPKRLKEWAYAGFVFNFLLGISAHLNVGDNEWPPALVALVLASLSYVYDRKANQV